jgi:hypothetical protein
MTSNTWSTCGRAQALGSRSSIGKRAAEYMTEVDSEDQM